MPVHCLYATTRPASLSSTQRCSRADDELVKLVLRRLEDHETDQSDRVAEHLREGDDAAENEDAESDEQDILEYARKREDQTGCAADEVDDRDVLRA